MLREHAHKSIAGIKLCDTFLLLFDIEDGEVLLYAHLSCFFQQSGAYALSAKSRGDCHLRYPPKLGLKDQIACKMAPIMGFKYSFSGNVVVEVVVGVDKGSLSILKLHILGHTLYDSFSDRKLLIRIDWPQFITQLVAVEETAHFKTVLLVGCDRTLVICNHLQQVTPYAQCYDSLTHFFINSPGKSLSLVFWYNTCPSIVAGELPLILTDRHEDKPHEPPLVKGANGVFVVDVQLLNKAGVKLLFAQVKAHRIIFEGQMKGFPHLWQVAR